MEKNQKFFSYSEKKRKFEISLDSEEGLGSFEKFFFLEFLIHFPQIFLINEIQLFL